MLESISCNANFTCQMFLSNQCTWGGVPRGSELLLHSLSHDANDEVVLMEDSHHVVVTLAVEPFPVHLLVLLVSHFSGYHGLLLATLHLWGHPSVQGATEMKRVWWICPWMTMSIEIGMWSKTSRTSLLIMHCRCITIAEHANQHQSFYNIYTDNKPLEY